MLLALALAVLAALIWYLAMLQVPEPAGPPQARSAPPDPVQAEVERWMHQWVRGRA